MDENRAIELGNYLKELRQRSKMSLREAAKKSGLSYTYISFLEKGIHPNTNKQIKATPEVLSKLAVAYEYPYEYLMEKAGYIKPTLLDFNSGDDPQVINESKDDYRGTSFAKPNVSKEIKDILFNNNDLTHNGRILTKRDKRRLLDILEILENDYYH